MLNRWFAAPRSPVTGNGDRQDSPVKEADFIVLPPAASDSWRSWLMTGVRRGRLDRRRMRGAHQDLKKMLIEGTNGPEDRPQPWNDFSSAMVRQTVDEALNALPPDQKQAVKLAYFGGLTNREIARHLGVAEGGVRRRLRQALAAVSAQVERGRVAGRRVVYAILGWLTARAMFDGAQRSSGVAADHVLQAAVAVTAGVVAVAVLVATPVPPALHNPAQGGGIQSAAPVGTSPVEAPKSAVPVAGSLPAVSPAVPAAPRLPGLPVVVPVTLPVTIPSPPTLPTALPSSLPQLPVH